VVRVSISRGRSLATVLSVALAAAPLAAGAQAPASPPAPATVPLSLIGNRLVVPVQIEGVGVRHFILDTAAGVSVVSMPLRDEIAPDPATVRQARVPGGGGVRIMEFIPLPPVRVGGDRVPGLQAVVADMTPFGSREGSPLDGILGVDVLRRYDVEIDLGAGRVRLHSHDGDAAARFSSPRPPVAFASQVPGFVEFRAEVGGQPVHAILDSGAPVSILNWRAAGLAGVTPQSPGVRVREEGSTGLDGRRIQTHLYVFDRVRVGGSLMPATEMRVADLPVFGTLGVGDVPAMLVGADLFRACAVLISYSTGNLHVCP
jgi:hypothetical protein